MKIIYIAVGTLRRPKLNAVWEAVSVFGPQLDTDARFEVVGVEVESGVGHTPLTRDETMTGARQRAETLVRLAQEKNEPWEYFVGLEGGLDVVGADLRVRPAELKEGAHIGAPLRVSNSRLVFLENWAYVCDRNGRNAFGRSGAILIPEALAVKVVDEGIEMSYAIDEYAGGRGIRDAQGAWGVFTRNTITRQDAFRTAVLNAFAPFYNPAIYQ
ncbi:MAG: DUF84 family protein [Acidobacteria bacterium]|nr:DUF84 family protein [Acidobacteriota bacterium]